MVDLLFSTANNMKGRTNFSSMRGCLHILRILYTSVYNTPATMRSFQCLINIVYTVQCNQLQEIETYKCCDQHEIWFSFYYRLLSDGRIPQTLRLTIRKYDPKRKYFGRESRQCPVQPTVFYQFSKGLCSYLVILIEDCILCTKKSMNEYYF